MRGHLAYYAVPGNIETEKAFRHQETQHQQTRHREVVSIADAVLTR